MQIELCAEFKWNFVRGVSGNSAKICINFSWH